MDEYPGLLTLPVYELHEICRYLSVDDILSLSLTCRHLRSALNDDVVWKRFLPEASEELSGLDLKQQQVQPVLQPDDSLTPLCDNRLLYIRKTHVINNWREARFVDSGEVTISEGIYLPRDVQFYQERYMFLLHSICSTSTYIIEMWDIQSVPVLYTSVNISSKGDVRFFIIGSYLVLTVCLKVYVYKINISEKELSLWYTFLVSERDVTFGDHVKRLCDCFCRCSYNNIVDQYLISYCKFDAPAMFHVWDIFNARKVGSFLTPVQSLQTWFVGYFSNSRNVWILEQRVQGDERYYFQFSIVTKKCSGSVFKCCDRNEVYSLFYNSHIIMFRKSDDIEDYSVTCTVYDFNTCIVVKENIFKISSHYPLNSTVIANGVFVLLWDRSIHLINALTLETVDCFQADVFMSEDDFFGSYLNGGQVDLWGSLFLVTCNFFGPQGELWDIKKKRKNLIFYKFEAGKQTKQHISKLHSKLVFVTLSGFRVFHCW